MIPTKLGDEVKKLQDEGVLVEVSESGGMACVVLRDHPLPPTYNKPVTDLLLRMPLSYPNGKPDMFWVDTEVSLTDGSVPQRAGTIETHMERQWRRFSWHPQSWNPATGDLRMFLEFVNCRLAKGV